MFLQVGDEEFKFIDDQDSPFFLFGIVQMLVWYFYPKFWILPYSVCLLVMLLIG